MGDDFSYGLNTLDPLCLWFYTTLHICCESVGNKMIILHVNMGQIKRRKAMPTAISTVDTEIWIPSHLIQHCSSCSCAIFETLDNVKIMTDLR